MRPGIDFGTTNSSIACFDGNRLHRLELDPANDNANILPSLIYIDRDHHAVVGTAAAIEYLRRETGRAVSWEKRRVGEIDDCSHAALFLAAPESSYVNGTELIIDGGFITMPFPIYETNTVDWTTLNYYEKPA